MHMLKLHRYRPRQLITVAAALMILDIKDVSYLWFLRYLYYFEIFQLI